MRLEAAHGEGQGRDPATVWCLLGHERWETTALSTESGARDLEAALRRLERDPEG